MTNDQLPIEGDVGWAMPTISIVESCRLSWEI